MERQPGLLALAARPGCGRRLGLRARRNLAGAFEIGVELAGLRVAIVDDVMTTGATATELAFALQEAGAAGVELWCLCRTPMSAGH